MSTPTGRIVNGHDYGEPTTYMVTWAGSKRKTEPVLAHAINFPTHGVNPKKDYPSSPVSDGQSHIRFYAAIGGKWRLVLSAKEEEIVSIRPILPEPEPQRY